MNRMVCVYELGAGGEVEGDTPQLQQQCAYRASIHTGCKRLTSAN